MFSRSGLLISFLSLTTVFAAPMDPYEPRLEDIQCRCLSFSTSAKPTLCTYLESQGLDWDTAHLLASENDMKIQFASKNTISKVLAIPKPLPSSVLQSLSHGEAVAPDAADLIKTENKIVCGLGDEAKHIGSHDANLDPECHYVGIVVAGFMCLLIAYLVGDYAWTRYSAQREGNIKLEGDEKALTAAQGHVECTAPTDTS